MKGKILKVTIVAAFALIAGMNVYNAQKSDVMSDLALANVEALAWNEIIVGEPCVYIPNCTCLYYYPWEQWEEDGTFYA